MGDAEKAAWKEACQLFKASPNYNTMRFVKGAEREMKKTDTYDEPAPALLTAVEAIGSFDGLERHQEAALDAVADLRMPFTSFCSALIQPSSIRYAIPHL